MNSLQRLSLFFTIFVSVGACSAGSGDDVSTTEVDSSVITGVSVAPEGTITHYGAVTISDDVGMAYDLIGGFFRLNGGVSADFMQSMLSGDSTHCDVQDDGVIDFEDISVGHIPQVPGVEKTSVSAGDFIVLSSSLGTYATLAEQPAAGFLFYDLPDTAMVMEGVVPPDLVVDVGGSSEFEPFIGATVPQVAPLMGVDYGASSKVTSSTSFSWVPSDNPEALIRIYTSTAGGFFLENGVTVTCVVPDTGEFTFPSSVQALLGTDFSGEPPILSRLVSNTVQVRSSVLYVIRESFGDEN